MHLPSPLSLCRGLCVLPRVCIGLVLSSLAFSLASAADWAQWRGPTRDGISTESGWSHAWSAAGPKVLWKSSVGIGCSSVTVANGRAYTMGNKNETDTVYCFDVETGKQLWTYSYPQPLDPKLYDGGPGCSPAIDGTRIYTMGRKGLLLCLEEGKVVWSKHLVKDFGGIQPHWGYNGSPLVLGEKLLVEVGGPGCSILALNKLTGEVLWKAGNDPISYSSPVVIEPGENPSVAFLAAKALIVRAAKDGRELWRFPWKTQHDINAACPLVVGGAVFISSGYGHGAALVKPGKSGGQAVWETKAMRNHMNSSVLWQNHIYGFDEDSLNCLDAATGAVKWKQAGMGKGSLVLIDGKLVIMSDKGKLVIAQPSPEKFVRLAEHQVLGEKKCWVVPTLSNGRLYCKNNFGELVALDVSAK